MINERMAEIAGYKTLVKLDVDDKCFLKEALHQPLSQIALLTKTLKRFRTLLSGDTDDEVGKIRMLVHLIQWMHAKMKLIGRALSKLEPTEARDDLICDMDDKVVQCQLCWVHLCTKYEYDLDDSPFEGRYNKPFSLYPSLTQNTASELAGGNSSLVFASVLREKFNVNDFHSSRKMVCENCFYECR